MNLAADTPLTPTPKPGCAPRTLQFNFLKKFFFLFLIRFFCTALMVLFVVSKWMWCLASLRFCFCFLKFFVFVV